MLAEGTYPYGSTPTGPRRGAPRVGDGLLRMDADGVVTYASPNAVSAFRRVGVVTVSGRSLAEVVTASLQERDPVDEALPLVVMGRAPWRCDLEMRGSVLSLRAVPLMRGAGAQPERVGALVLVRDVTEVRRSERALMTKEATIREIHHRVKNNLQTVSALLRMQARRTSSDEARSELQEAGRRIAAIAGVYDTLAHEIDETVPFDSVVDTGLANALELATGRRAAPGPPDARRLVRAGAGRGRHARSSSSSTSWCPTPPSTGSRCRLPDDTGDLPRAGSGGTVTGRTSDGSPLVVHVDDDGKGIDRGRPAASAAGSSTTSSGPSCRARSRAARREGGDPRHHRGPPALRPGCAAGPALPLGRTAGPAAGSTARRRAPHLSVGRPPVSSGAWCCVASARATGAGGAALEGAALVLAHAAPDAGVLAGLDGPLEAGVDDVAPTAHGLGLLDLEDGGSGVPDREEQLGVLLEARCTVTPVHGSLHFASTHGSPYEFRVGVPGPRCAADRVAAAVSCRVRHSLGAWVPAPSWY